MEELKGIGQLLRNHSFIKLKGRIVLQPKKMRLNVLKNVPIMKMKLNIDHSEKFDELVKEVPIENLFQLLQMGSWKLVPKPISSFALLKLLTSLASRKVIR